MFNPKTWMCYSITGELPSFNQLRANIEQCPSVELDKRSSEHVGFTFPVGLENDEHARFQLSEIVKDRYLVFAIKHQVRKVPKEAVQKKLDIWRDEYQKKHGEPPKSAHVREAKEDIKQQLAPQYPPDITIIEGAIDFKRKLILWSDTKVNPIELSNNRIRGSFKFGFAPGFEPGWFDSEVSLLMTRLFVHKEAEPLTFGNEVTLKGSDGEAITARKITLPEADNLHRLIEEGYSVTKIALVTETPFGFAEFTFDTKQNCSKWTLVSIEGEKVIANTAIDSFSAQCFANLSSFDKTLDAIRHLGKKFGVHPGEPEHLPSDTGRNTDSQTSNGEQNDSDNFRPPLEEHPADRSFMLDSDIGELNDEFLQPDNTAFINHH